MSGNKNRNSWLIASKKLWRLISWPFGGPTKHDKTKLKWIAKIEKGSNLALRESLVLRESLPSSGQNHPMTNYPPVIKHRNGASHYLQMIFHDFPLSSLISNGRFHIPAPAQRYVSPSKKMFCPRFSILYGWDCIGIYLYIYIYDEAQSYIAGSLPPC